MKNTTPDYYAILEVDAGSSPDEIRASFKKLALKYHPDVYKGSDAEDAEEKMRHVLEAYQVLNDPEKRQAYNLTRSPQKAGSRIATTGASSGGPTRKGNVVTPKARRDQQRHYDFPDFRPGQIEHLDLGDFSYTLNPQEAATLRDQGLVRGVAPTSAGRPSTELYCHRCHNHWTASQNSDVEPRCPHCHADDWSEYLLLHCLHCNAAFESEQIRYEIGYYEYGNRKLCPPYELFPLCPYCAGSNWCPAENQRVEHLREETARQQNIMLGLRFILLVGILLAILVVGALVLR